MTKSVRVAQRTTLPMAGTGRVVRGMRGREPRLRTQLFSEQCSTRGRTSLKEIGSLEDAEAVCQTALCR